MVPIFAELSLTRGITMIVGRTQIMFAVRSTDLTDDVLARLDEVLPDVDLSLPETQ
jgi:Skp family chaperone for outer membrane proteins